MNEKELLSRLAELPREIRPRRDPWPEISARIERSGTVARRTYRTPGWMFRAAAASVLLALAAGLLLRPLWNTDPLDSVKFASNEATPGLLDAVDAEYLAAFREFINVGGSRDSLAPQTIEKIEMGWADLRVTETALAAALEENPGDLFLSERMLELRDRQLGFLKQLITLDRNNRRMTI